MNSVGVAEVAVQGDKLVVLVVVVDELVLLDEAVGVVVCVASRGDL
jgi:hypothetical protein